LTESKQYYLTDLVIRASVDPIMEITCLGSKKYTSCKKGIGQTGTTPWGEHLFFEAKKLVNNFAYLIMTAGTQ
jgi:hypothetical protein